MSKLVARVQRAFDSQFLAALAITFVVEIGLSISTLPRLTKLFGIRLAGEGDDEPTGQEPDVAPEWFRGRSAAVHSVLRHWPFGDTCLRRSLILGQRIRRLDPVLVIGVRHDEHGKLAAHAWLTVGGVALDTLAEQYAPLRGLNET
ncbi:MAG: lasso peptide biosynthesis B2 protein [Pseudonocardiaceae bacterium]